MADQRTYPQRPILAVSAAIIRDGKVLIVRRARKPALNLYTLPGGAVEAGEQLADAVVREVREETRLARQILIGVEQGGDEAAALKKAEGIAAEARAGKDFAALAKQHSTDLTAAQGGLLDPVTKSQFPGPMGDTLFQMKVGDVSAPVKSQYGYHIFKLEGIEAQQEQPFAEVRAELDSQYRQDKAAELFGERQDQIQAALEKGTTDLDKLATDLGLTRGTVETFLRGGGGEPLGSGPDLQATVFSDETLNQGKIGGPVELGEDRLVLVKVTAHHKAAVKPLPEVRAEIETLLRTEQATAAAKAAAEEALRRLQAGEKLEDVAKSLGVTAEPARFVGRADPSVPAALRTAVFDAARPTDKPVIKMATLDDGSSALLVVSASRTADSGANPALAEQQKQSRRQPVDPGNPLGGHVRLLIDRLPFVNSQIPNSVSQRGHVGSWALGSC